MNYLTPWLPPSDTANARTADTRTFILERRTQFITAVLPFAILGGTPRIAGIHTMDSTTLTDAVVMNVLVTAPILHYQFQVFKSFGVGVTSVNYSVELHDTPGIADTVLLSGSSSVDGDGVTGEVDLFSTVSQDVFTRLAQIRLQVSYTGGTGEGAGVRMVRPWSLRPPG